METPEIGTIVKKMWKGKVNDNGFTTTMIDGIMYHIKYKELLYITKQIEIVLLRMYTNYFTDKLRLWFSFF